MTDELQRQIALLEPGNHVCQIYEAPAERLAAAVAFFKEGLARNERCVYFTDDRIRDEVIQGLLGAGVAVAHQRERGALRFLLVPEPYFAG